MKIEEFQQKLRTKNTQKSIQCLYEKAFMEKQKCLLKKAKKNNWSHSKMKNKLINYESNIFELAETRADKLLGETDFTYIKSLV